MSTKFKRVILSIFLQYKLLFSFSQDLTEDLKGFVKKGRWQIAFRSICKRGNLKHEVMLLHIPSTYFKYRVAYLTELCGLISKRTVLGFEYLSLLLPFRLRSDWTFQHSISVPLFLQVFNTPTFGDSMSINVDGDKISLNMNFFGYSL